MKELRAKLIKSTNLEIDENIPKDVFANISFEETVSWTLNKEFWFNTSPIERFSFDDKTKFLSVYTKNNRYDFELEFDCEVKFDETLKSHTLTLKTPASEKALMLHFKHLMEHISSLSESDEKQFLVRLMEKEVNYHSKYFGNYTGKLFCALVNYRIFVTEHKAVMKYITAVSALNIPCNGIQCDWHQVEMLKNKFYQIHPLNFTGAEDIFGDYGIYDNTEFFTNKGFEVSGVMVASPIRALLDILFNAIVAKSAYPNHFRMCDYMFDEIDRAELVEKLDIFGEHLSGDTLEMLLRWRVENEI